MALKRSYSASPQASPTRPAGASTKSACPTRASADQAPMISTTAALKNCIWSGLNE
eukprot:CAMPEP_0114647596 /NCGR_PEP_ID=MMETSP0191-20121206/5866_1 /TAXON_ID=126664 /ORGANISM="Sorites sp." /LENGTH=55 /DNA_ID=CAMNT_0001860697 /DNA_START=230 /DNA_END=397 /DNA_ORIENTATION=+